MARSRIVLRLDEKVDESLFSEIIKQSVYVSEDAESIDIDKKERTLIVDVSEGADTKTIEDKFSRFLSVISAKFRKMNSKIYFSNLENHPLEIAENVFDILVEKGWLFPIGHGQVALAGLPLNLLKGLDRRLETEYKKRFRHQDRYYPAMIRADLLYKCGYFDSHPDALTFVSHLKEDFDGIERFRVQNSSNGYVRNTKDFTPEPEYCLNPAACFPSYETFEGKKVGEGITISWTGRVFRYESKNIQGLDRLWEYNVRELVAIGPKEFVIDFKERCLRMIEELISEWELYGKIETAADSFFATVHTAKSFWQKPTDSKLEIKLPVKRDGDEIREIAAGSINIHGTFFGERFSIKAGVKEEHAESACLGWGLERLLFAVLARHGLDDSKWPESLRQLLI
ncbi:aminoacyl--tRNA ligase-related protein [Leptospira ellisii]|uniref:aminoacyl--tRNA ligase-related protein n=1 Tax=Leptospira ellisii TaxID=2023197 RepID=UPI000C29903C|nr:aminoacyl--tRNA ligase-related protein [Leptospira ellisii]PKA05200.1 hypothetical protein CH375_06480 [Leptospira ellisii]